MPFECCRASWGSYPEVAMSTGPLPAASAENEFAQDLFHGLPARYDALAEILSFWQNGRWRRELVARVAASEPPSRWNSHGLFL